MMEGGGHSNFGHGLPANKVNDVLQSLRAIEDSVEKHKTMILSLKNAFGSPEIDNPAVGSNSGGNRTAARGVHGDTPQMMSVKTYTFPSAHNVTHPSKNAVSSLALGEPYRRRFDCSFAVRLDHPLPLMVGQTMWIGGFTSMGKLLLDKFSGDQRAPHSQPGQAVDFQSPICPHIDLDSGVYRCTVKTTYTFDVTISRVKRKGAGNSKVYLCRDRDGLREVMMTITDNKEQDLPMHTGGGFNIGFTPTNQLSGQLRRASNRQTITDALHDWNSYGYDTSEMEFENENLVRWHGCVEWLCEVGDRIWLEIMTNAPGTMLTDVTFCGWVSAPMEGVP